MLSVTAIKGALQGRVANALLVAARGFIVSVARTFYALWLQATGLVFAVFTVAGSSDLVRHYRADHLQDHRRTVIVAAFTLACLWFTVLSFVKARRTRR
jgi:cellulase/cellobiase CelA1